MHEEFYAKSLEYINDYDAFIDQIEREKFPHLINTKIERVLEVKPSNHFGEAFKRLQSLFFMLRENDDVFDVFCKNAYRIRYHTNGTFPETLLNFLFNDLTSFHASSRLAIVIEQIIKKEVEISDTPE